MIVKLPEDLDAQSEIRRSALLTQTPLRLLADLFVAYDYSALDADVEAYTTEELLMQDQETRQLPGFLAVHGGTAED